MQTPLKPPPPENLTGTVTISLEKYTGLMLALGMSLHYIRASNAALFETIYDLTMDKQ